MWVFACYIFLERWGKIFHHFVHVLLCSDYINHMFFVNVSSDADNGLCLWGNDEKMLKCLAVGNLNIIKSWCFSPWKKKKRKKKKEIRIIYKAHMQIIFRFRRILMSFKFQMSGLYDDFSFPDIFPPIIFSQTTVCYGKHIAYPANFHFSSRSHSTPFNSHASGTGKYKTC